MSNPLHTNSKLTQIAEQFDHVTSYYSLLHTIEHLKKEVSETHSKFDLLQLDDSQASQYITEVFSNVLLFHISSAEYVTLCESFVMSEATKEALYRYCFKHTIRYYHYTKDYRKLTELLIFLEEKKVKNSQELLEEALLTLEKEEAMGLREELDYYFLDCFQ